MRSSPRSIRFVRPTPIAAPSARAAGCTRAAAEAAGWRGVPGAFPRRTPHRTAARSGARTSTAALHATRSGGTPTLARGAFAPPTASARSPLVRSGSRSSTWTRSRRGEPGHEPRGVASVGFSTVSDGWWPPERSSCSSVSRSRSFSDHHRTSRVPRRPARRWPSTPTTRGARSRPPSRRRVGPARRNAQRTRRRSPTRESLRHPPRQTRAIS